MGAQEDRADSEEDAADRHERELGDGQVADELRGGDTAAQPSAMYSPNRMPLTRRLLVQARMPPTAAPAHATVSIATESQPCRTSRQIGV